MKFSGKIGNGPVHKVLSGGDSIVRRSYGHCRNCFPDSSLLGDTEVVSGHKSAAASSHSFILIHQMAGLILRRCLSMSTHT